MTSPRHLLPPEWQAKLKSTGKFTPSCVYFPLMDSLMYLHEDVSYRSKYIDGNLFHLLAPQSEELVGIRFEGASISVKKLADKVHADWLAANPPEIRETLMNMIKNNEIPDMDDSKICLSSLLIFSLIGRSDVFHNEYRTAIDFLDGKEKNTVSFNPYEVLREQPKTIVFS